MRERIPDIFRNTALDTTVKIAPPPHDNAAVKESDTKCCTDPKLWACTRRYWDGAEYQLRYGIQCQSCQWQTGWMDHPPYDMAEALAASSEGEKNEEVTFLGGQQ